LPPAKRLFGTNSRREQLLGEFFYQNGKLTD
jgi:hypothetical protein